jgi:hypothetical protein
MRSRGSAGEISCHLVMRSEADWFLDWRTVNTRTAQCRSSHHLCPCPEEVIPHGAPVEEPTVSVQEEGVEDVVRGEVVPAHQHAKPAAAQVPTDADGGADPRGNVSVWVAMPMA